MKTDREVFELLWELDKIYGEVIHGHELEQEKLDGLIQEILQYDRTLNEEYNDVLAMAIKIFGMKVNLINQLNERTPKQEEEFDKIRDTFKILEMKRFEIINNYVMGTVKKADIERFGNLLFNFRKRLYAIPICDSNLLEIAKMKSKIQHFETEVLEDEDVLRVAYQNES